MELIYLLWLVLSNLLHFKWARNVWLILTCCYLVISLPCQYLLLIQWIHHINVLVKCFLLMLHVIYSCFVNFGSTFKNILFVSFCWQRQEWRWHGQEQWWDWMKRILIFDNSRDKVACSSLEGEGFLYVCTGLDKNILFTFPGNIWVDTKHWHKDVSIFELWIQHILS